MMENLGAARIDAQRAKQAGDMSRAKKCWKKVDDLKSKCAPDSEDEPIVYHLPNFSVQSKQAVVNSIKRKRHLLNKGNYDGFGRLGLFLWSTIIYSDQNTNTDWHQLVADGYSGGLEHTGKNFDFFFIFCEPTSTLVHLSGTGDFIANFHVDTSKYDGQLNALSRDS